MGELVEELLEEVGVGSSCWTATFTACIEIAKDGDVAHHGASIELAHTVNNALGLRIAAAYFLHDAVDGAILAIVGQHHVLEETEERGDDHGHGTCFRITCKVKTNQLNTLGILARHGFDQFEDIELARDADVISYVLCGDIGSSLHGEAEFVHLMGETTEIGSNEVLEHVNGLGFGGDSEGLQESRENAWQFVLAYLVALIHFANLFAKLHKFGGTSNGSGLVCDNKDGARAGLFEVETKVVELEGTLIEGLCFAKQNELFFGHHGETTTSRDNVTNSELTSTRKELHQIEVLLVVSEHRVQKEIGELIDEKGFFAMQEIDRSIFTLLNLGLYALKIVGFLCHLEFLLYLCSRNN